MYGFHLTAEVFIEFLNPYTAKCAFYELLKFDKL